MNSLFSHIHPASLAGAFAAGGLTLGIASRFLVRSVQADSNSPSKTFGVGPSFLSLPLESSISVNHNTKLLRFKLPGHNAVSGLPLTSALLTMSWPTGSWFPVARPYTPVSSSDAPGYIELLVKHYPSGRSSTHLHSLKPGDTLLIAAAIKGYAWQPNSYKHITLVAGGAGITPLYQLAQGILRNPNDHTTMALVFGVNSDKDILLKREFDQFERDYPGRFKATYVVSSPAEDSPHRRGYVTRKLLEEVAPAPGTGSDTKVFVCGPPAMEAALVGKRGHDGILQQMGYKKSQIHRF
ncbi:hypothetical protein B0I35DRAFT_419729 [Stachybotrys elegans]|uniref:NADH-cytochrome b5 reductase n=1 Tax=Stachybotrys elegans TaxID=80388 RepID=A0A8K0T2Y5_9HYPO|nr:hypothetical protein B0I35DRAFT_419729 [Stachybotrys elegans]